MSASRQTHRVIKRHRGESATEAITVEYCTRADGQHLLDTICESTFGVRYSRSVHFVGDDGENWIAELVKVYE